jgi:hypothetical protein
MAPCAPTGKAITQRLAAPPKVVAAHTNNAIASLMSDPSESRIANEAFTTSARLGRSEKLAFARQAVGAQLKALPGIVLAKAGLGARESALQLQADPPDSAYTRQAAALAEEVYGAELLNHCLRCWYFGDLFAQIERRVYDPELLYIACLMHDFALTDDHRPTGKDAPCFAVHGGQLARQTLQGWGAGDRTAQTVAEAIAAHMNVSVPVEAGVEAHLLHAAAHLDVAGTRVGEVPRSLIKQINAAHPRNQFAQNFIDAMRTEAHEHPDSRTAVLWKLGMRIPIRLNPVDAYV